MTTLDDAISEARRKLNLELRRGILGNAAGVVRIVADGKYYVRIEKSPGIYFPAVPLRLAYNAVVAPENNIPVYIGYDPTTKEDVITGMVPFALAQIGVSPLITNPSDPASSDLIPQEKLATLYSRPHTDSATKPFYAIVYPAKLIRQDGILASWSGGEIDLVSYLPATGLHKYVGVFLKEDFATLEAAGSTAQATGSALDDSDLNEVLAGASPGSIPVRAYKLDGDDTALRGAFSDSPFLRQFVTTRTHYPGTTYFDASEITYTPAIDTHWSGSVDPGNDNNALDQLASRVTVLEEASPATSEYFLTDTASDLAGYLAMTPAIGGTQSTVVDTVTGADQAIEEWATPANSPGLQVLSGIVHFHIHAAQTSGTKTVQIYAKLYTRASGGAETLIGTSELSSNVPGTETHVELDMFVDEADLDLTDRLVAKVLATPGGSGTDPELTLYMEGATNSRLDIPIAGGDINAAQIGYTPAVLADWDSSADPGMTNDALDQLAERVTDIEASPGGTVAAFEDGVSVVATADTFDFKDFNIEDAGSNDAAIYHNLPHTWQSRLTLESGVPVSTTDQTAKTTVYLTPYKGDKISLYDGTRWKVHTLSEISINVTDAQTGTTHNGTAIIDGLTDTSQLIVGMEVTGTGVGASANIVSIDSATQVTVDVNSTADGSVTITFKVPASTVLDIFCFPSSGTPKLEMVAWTDATTRATALTTQDDVYVKSGATTRRYAGTICTTTTAGQTEDSVLHRLLWNYYNRARREILQTSTDNSWTYGTTSFRQANANAANQIDLVVGLQDAALALFLLTSCTSSGTGIYGIAAIGEDSTTTPHASCHRQGGGNLATVWNNFATLLTISPVPGYHYYAWLEYASNATITFYAGSGASKFRGGLSGYIEG